jgi:hypothetical protein
MRGFSRQPILSNARYTLFALVDGNLLMPVLDHASGKRATISHNTELGDGKADLIRRTLFDFNAIRHNPQRQRFHF